MPDYKVFQLNVSTLTPIHIGSGETLLHEYDYAIQAGQTWRINESALMDAQDVDDPALAERLARTPPARLLKTTDFHAGSGYFRYAIQGTPRSSAEGAQVQEQIKDVFDRVYLPGSSIKGSLRTMLAWNIWKQMGLKPEFSKLGRKGQWAGQRYEQEIFGRDPNNDLLRALQVSDSQPVGPERLMILNVRVLNRGGGMASPIELEAIRPDTTFTLSIKIDQALFSDWAKRHGLSLRGGNWLENLAIPGQAHAHQRIADEIEWFQSIPNAKRLLGFYQQLEKLEPQLAENRFFLQFAWGTGWGDKTFGSHLQEDQPFMEHLIDDYRLARGRRQPGDPFPKSRRVAVSITKSHQGSTLETPAYPLGWVLVEIMSK